MMSKNIVISTYPRSGKNFFVDLFKIKTDVTIPSTHLNGHDEKEHVGYLNDFEHVVTILREPVSSISSLIAMESITHSVNYFDDLDKTEMYAQYMVDKKIEDYLNFYKQVKQNSTIIIDFNLFISKFDYVIDSVIDITNTPLCPTTRDFSDLDIRNTTFPRTSKNEIAYTKILNCVSEQDLNTCFKEFNDAKNYINLVDHVK
jgi:hypothetical protein